MFRATPIRITGAVTIKAHLFLGATVDPGGGTLTIDRGGSISAGSRLATVAAGEHFLPNFPVVTDHPAAADELRSRIHCAGSTNATIFYSE
jgi:hypothetical protein